MAIAGDEHRCLQVAQAHDVIARGGVFGDVDFRAIETGAIERAECGIAD